MIRRINSNIRYFSSCLNNLNRVKRQHGNKRIINKGNSKEIKSLNFKPVNKINGNITLNNNNDSQFIDEIIDEKQLKWRDFLKNNEKTNQEMIQDLLKTIIQYSEFSKLEKLKDNLWQVLKNKVIIYDNLVGPKEEIFNNEEIKDIFQYPNNIKECIIECRNNKDYDNMILVYDYFFQLLTKSTLIKELDNRERLIRLNEGIENEEDIEHINKLKELINELEINNKINKNGNKLIKEIKQEWFKIKEPRNLKIFKNINNEYNKLIKLINKEEINELFYGKFIELFCFDLINSEMKFEYNEISIMVKNFIKFKKPFNFENYKIIKEIINKEIGLILIPEIFEIFLNKSLKIQDFKLFEIILKDFENEGFLINKGIIELIIKYYSNIGDLNNFLKMIEFRNKIMKLPLINKDFKILIDCLIRLNKRDIAIDLVKSLIIVRNGIEINNDDNKEDNIKDNQLLQEIEDPIEDFSLMNIINDNNNNNEILIIKPNINDEIINNLLISVESYQEFEKLINGEIFNKEISEISSELIKIELLIKDKFQIFNEDNNNNNNNNKDIRFKEFQDTLLKGFENMKIKEIEKFVNDKEVIEVILKISEKFIEDKVIDVDNEEGDNIIKSVQVLYNKLEERGDGDKDQEDKTKKLVMSILTLGGINV